MEGGSSMKLPKNFFEIGNGIFERLPNGMMAYVGKKPQYEDIIKFGTKRLGAEFISEPKKDSK